VFRAIQITPGYEDPQLGWGPHAADVDVHEVPGDHGTLTEEPHVGVLAERLKRCLEASE
jgi:thioesterase domain-containing protein